MFDISFIYYLNTLNNNRYQTKYLNVFYDEFGQNHTTGVGNMTFLVKIVPPGL